MNLLQWYQLPNQKFLKTTLLQHVEHWLKQKSPAVTLQTGSVRLSETALYSIHGKRIVIFSSTKNTQGNIIGCYEQLAILPKSIDLLIILHTFEQCDSPHQFLRECNRVIRDDGQVIVIGFNHYYIQAVPGLASFILRFPKLKRLIKSSQLDDWFSLLGLSKQGYCLLFRNKQLDTFFNGTIAKLNRLFLGQGDVYCCLYQKQVIPLTLDMSVIKTTKQRSSMRLLETKNYE